MGKFDGVLLISDVCDTLIDTSSGAFTKGNKGELKPVSEVDRQALEYFTAEGGRFTVATGRGMKYVQPYVDSIPINAPAVMGDGAALCDLKSGEFLETAWLDEQAQALGQAVLDRFSTTTVSARPLVDGSFYYVRPDSMARLQIKLGHTQEISSLLEAPLPMQSLRFSDQHRTLEEIQDFLRAQDKNGAYELVIDGHSSHDDYDDDHDGHRFYLLMTAKGSGKGNMVRLLAEHLGISMEHVYCAGNGDDDVSMLTAAKQGFAPYLECTPAAAEHAIQLGHAGRGLMAAIIDWLDKEY